jgi:hypothetical protein
MASYTLGVGESTPEVDQQPWQMDGIFCPTCSLGAFRGTSRWTRTTATTITQTFTYSCLARHTWTRDVPGHCPTRPADNTAAASTADQAARLAHA